MFRMSKYLLISSSVRFKHSKGNEGISRTLKLILKNDPDVKMDEEILDNLDTDFMNARDIQRHHERELSKMKKKIEFKKIERSLSRQVKNPNMLTWAEKELIRKLNDTEPDIWTIEKLSQSFPATPDIIKKLLKSNWKPESTHKISKHDLNVANNWKKFRRGDLTINSPELIDHLNKFATRENLVTKEEGTVPALKEVQKPLRVQEFSSIITKYQQKINKENVNEDISAPINLHLPRFENKDSDTFLMPRNNNSPPRIRFRHYTLEKLRKEVESSLKNEEHISETDRLFLKVPEDGEILPLRQVTKELRTEINSESNKHNQILPQYKVSEVTQISDEPSYKLKINIPTEKWKSGGIYRVNDCFYNSEGEFLYRVPGFFN